MDRVTTPSEKSLKGGRYVLTRTLGEGGQGETWEARVAPPPAAPPEAPPRALTDDWNRFVAKARGDSAPALAVARAAAPGRLVAIKAFRVGKAKQWKDVELAEREAKTLALLDHPLLPKYIEHFEEDGALYLVMEKIEGESLAAIRARGGHLSAAEIVRMLEDVGSALRYLHRLAPPVIHRDVKPGNVIRRPDGSFALVDFGSVRDRLKQGGSTVVGTFGYMAPEQFQGRASLGSDVYGLGATAITLLTGREPEDLPHEGLGIDVRRALPRSTPKEIVAALEAMLVPDPDRRARTIDEALAHLGRDRSPPRPEEPVVVARPLSRAEKRERKRAQRRAEHEERRRRRAARHARRPPFLPRIVAQLGLSIAIVAVWAAVGVVVPLVLVLLSLVFGKALGRASRACVDASNRAIGAMKRASAWLGGHRPEDDEDRSVNTDGQESDAGVSGASAQGEGAGPRGPRVGGDRERPRVRVQPTDRDEEFADESDGWEDEPEAHEHREPPRKRASPRAR